MISMRLLPGFLLSLSIAGALTPLLEAQRPARPKVYREVVRAHWLEDGTRFWYRNDLAGGTREFVLVDAEKGTRLPAFDHAAVAERLSALTGNVIEAERLPVDTLRFEEKTLAVELRGKERSWRLDLQTHEVTESDATAESEGIPFDRTPRPSGSGGPETHVTFVNRLAETVALQWIDGSGGLHEYGELGPGERKRQRTFAGHVWMVTRGEGEILAVFDAPREGGLAVIDGRDPTQRSRRRREERTPRTEVPSPDDRWVAFVRDHDLWVREAATGEERPLAFEGCDGDSYRKDVQRARLVEMEYDATDPPDTLPDVIWSPDSRHLIAKRTRTVRERRVYMVESAPKDQVQPRLHSYPYLKPGDDLPVGRPQLFDAESGVHLPLGEELFPNPWNVSRYHWTPDGSRCFFLYNERGHQTMRVLAMDAATGETRAVVDERCTTFFDYQGKTHLEHLDDTDELIWMSERDGWNHLYLYDRVTGRVKNQITRGPWVVRGVERVDAERRRIWFRACGIVPGQDPYLVHHARIDLDGSNLVVLTEGDGTHRIQWSPDRRFLVDTWSRVDLPPVHVLRSGESGTLICALDEADASEVLATGRRFPEPFVAKGRDDVTDIHGIIHRPADFDPTLRYPVIECIYAGPHGSHVPKSFRADHRVQSLADRGFVVVQIDGMGTNWRSKAFHDVCWRNLADAGFPDRIRWIRAAAERYPHLDATRVGIYGGSAGGQNALGALLTHGDFYKVGVADCGCHDNRMDKIWWNEQWMGYPVGPHYAAQSNVTLAPGLKGELLLIVGELDRNVDPASTMQVVDALVRADKDFEMLVLPGVGHGAAGTRYGRRRQHEFFVRHLLE